MDNTTERLYKALKSAKESYDLATNPNEVPLPMMAIGVVQGCFITVDWKAIEEYEEAVDGTDK